MIAADTTDVTPSSFSIPTNTLWLNELLIDASIKWQVHNCKITDDTVTQDATLPFLYHYDTLSADLKAAHPLTPALLKRFNEPMSAAEAAHLLQLPVATIPAPWQVKVIGTLVLFSESLQIAVRLRFTNTAKALEPIYISDKTQAVAQAMQTWHFFSDVFVLNKCAKPIGVLPAESYASTLIVANDADRQTAAIDPATIATETTNNTETIHDSSRFSHNANSVANVNSTNSASNDATGLLDERALLQNTALLLPRENQYQHLQPRYAVALLSELEAHKADLPELDKAIQARIA